MCEYPFHAKSQTLNVGVVLLSLFSSAVAATPTAASCTDLLGLKISASDIGLPSGGGSVMSAEMTSIEADPKTPGIMRDYCKVLGEVSPIDRNAPPVKFQVNLPLEWNGKALQQGGGGFNGALVAGTNAMTGAPGARQPAANQPLDVPAPIARGFATWGTDSGHSGGGLTATAGVFALNDEALINFAYAAYKKTHDVGVHIAQAFYGRPPAKIYYFGGSEGGREGLTMAQRFPTDYDGIMSAAPAISMTALLTAFNHAGLVQQNGGWLSPAKVSTLNKAVNAACDALDGLTDGVISAYEKCVSVFDPRKLRCSGGEDGGDACLSDAQIEAIETVHRRSQTGFALANGVSSYPGWNYGSETQADGFIDWITGMQPPQVALSQTGQALVWNLGTTFVRHFVVRNGQFDPLRFSTLDFADRVRNLSALLDSTDPDLSAFMAHGGKLILKAHGADFAISPFEIIDYYKSVVAKMGQDKVDTFVRFYVTPGVSHGGTGVDSQGTAIPNAIDLIRVLDEWADKGEAPGTLVQTAQQRQAPFRSISSRPMCRYPLYPRFNGTGDPNAASDFSCTTQ